MGQNIGNVLWTPPDKDGTNYTPLNVFRWITWGSLVVWTVVMEIGLIIGLGVIGAKYAGGPINVWNTEPFYIMFADLFATMFLHTVGIAIVLVTVFLLARKIELQEEMQAPLTAPEVIAIDNHKRKWHYTTIIIMIGLVGIITIFRGVTFWLYIDFGVEDYVAQKNEEYGFTMAYTIMNSLFVLWIIPASIYLMTLFASKKARI